MKILLILAHPDPESFNHAMASAIRSTLERLGHAVGFHDLYAEQFDPILPAEEISRNAALPEVVRRHCRELADAEGLVIVHPNWWGQPPAILKGWVDRVFRPDVAYRFLEGDGGEGVPEGLLKIRTAAVFNTSNTPKERELAVFGDPLERLWGDCIFGLCGIRKFHRRTYRVIVTSTAAERMAWLEEVRFLAERWFTGGVSR
jgi:putative NADPH-quinone reductase